MNLINKIKKQVQKIAGIRQVLKRIKPVVDFDASTSPPAPDYKNLLNWAAHPEFLSKVAYTPEGIPGTNAWKEGAVDCFYVYPTLNFNKENWNAAIDQANIKELVAEIILPGQVSVFNSCCRIFAPRYRQATFYSFIRTRKNGRAALALAGSDILAAFDYYIEHFNKDRPFFIAGHSQGALHVMRLLEERIDGTPLAKKLVAAYPIGFYFPMDKFKRTLSTLKPSTSAKDIHCIVAWDTYLINGGPKPLLDRAEICYTINGQLHWEKRARKKILGINPLNWSDKEEAITAEQHKGGVFTYLQSKKRLKWEAITAKEILGLNCTGLSKPYPKQVAAHIGKNGFLFVTNPKYRAFRRLVLPGGYLHVFDIALFYMDLRENIVERWESFQEKREIIIRQ